MTADLKPNPDRTWQVLASSTAGSRVSVYCDTGIIVAIVMGEVDPFFDEAVRFLKAVKASGARLVISSLALSEAVDVIRKRVKANHRCTDESGRELQTVDAEAEAAVKDVGRIIAILAMDKMADMYEDITSAQPDLVHLYKRMLACQGETPQASKGNTYRHKGVGPIDLIHIALAHLSGARAMCTTDKALTQVGGDKQYGGMEIIVLRPR